MQRLVEKTGGRTFKTTSRFIAFNTGSGWGKWHVEIIKDDLDSILCNPSNSLWHGYPFFDFKYSTEKKVDPHKICKHCINKLRRELTKNG